MHAAPARHLSAEIAIAAVAPVTGAVVRVIVETVEVTIEAVIAIDETVLVTGGTERHAIDETVHATGRLDHAMVEARTHPAADVIRLIERTDEIVSGRSVHR